MGCAVSKKVTNNAPARERKPRIVYSDSILDLILDRVAAGEALSRVCSSADMPTRKSFFEWVEKDPSIKAKYEFAIQLRADGLVDELLAIADDGMSDTYTDSDGNERTNQEVIARSRLRVDARKWLASKMAPKRYGDKTSTEITGADGGPLEFTEIKRTIVRPTD